MKILAALAFITLFAPMAYGYTMPRQMGRYIAIVKDGDTFRWIDRQNPDKALTVRIMGLDAPEFASHANCPKELLAGYEAAFRLQQLLSARKITVYPRRYKKGWRKGRIRPGKYSGRILARVFVDGRDVAKLMISEGYGREYHGGHRDGWCK